MRLEFLKKALYFPDMRILVIADLHIGYEEALRKQGVSIPVIQFEETIKDLKEILNKKVDEIIIAGDLKHEFGSFSERGRKEVEMLINFLRERSNKLVVVKGNHDTFLGSLLNKMGVEFVDLYVKEELCVMHGHKFYPGCLDKKFKILVVGHRHPAIVISDGYKQETYKCFLKGRWKNKDVVILPSFFQFIEGSDVANEAYMDNNLFIKDEELKKFDVYVIGDKVYKFGKLKSYLR